MFEKSLCFHRPLLASVKFGWKISVVLNVTPGSLAPTDFDYVGDEWRMAEGFDHSYVTWKFDDNGLLSTISYIMSLDSSSDSGMIQFQVAELNVLLIWQKSPVHQCVKGSTNYRFGSQTVDLIHNRHCQLLGHVCLWVSHAIFSEAVVSIDTKSWNCWSPRMQ